MEVANLSLQTVQKRYGISPDDMIELYNKMLIIRRIEESCQLAYDRDKVGGYMHLFVGQEALAVGFIAAIRPDDYVLAGYRDHAYALTLGMTPEKMMADYKGNRGKIQGRFENRPAQADKKRAPGFIENPELLETGIADQPKWRGEF